MRLFYHLLISGLFIINSISALSQARCGNNIDTKTGPPNPDRECEDCSFDTYSGNEFREIKDLEAWGSPGQVQLTWMRYGNSRFEPTYSPYGEGHYWNSSFIYTMEYFSPAPNQHAHIAITFPDGSHFIYVQDANDMSCWNAPAACKNQLFENGSTFFLQTDDGYRYRFEKLTTPSGSDYYQLRDFRDNRQNLYTLTYDTDHRLIRVTEPAGRFLEITYGTVNRISVITQVVTSDGRKVLYHYTDTPVKDSIVPHWVALDTVYYGDGTKATYSYSQREPGSRPVLSHAIDPRVEGNHENVVYTYSDTVRVTGFISSKINGVTGTIMSTLIVGRENNIVCYANGKTETSNLPTSQRGQLRSRRDGLGRKTEYEYFRSGVGFLKSVTDALGRKTVYSSKTIYGNLLQVIYPDGSSEKWTRDSLDLILSHTDELKRVTTYTRDAKHRVTQIDYPNHSFERFSYNDFGEVLEHRQKNGAIEHFVYDGRGLLIQFTDGVGNSTFYTYDSASRLALVKDALDHTTGYGYNERGLLVKITNADGSFKSYNYDEFGNQTATADELNHTWTTKYDEFRRRLTVSDPLNRITKYEYDLPGGICACAHDKDKPTRITSPGGKVTEIEYDMEWEKIRETNGAGTPDAATTFYEYDLAGNVVNVIDPKGKIWHTEYDSRDRKISSTDPKANKTSQQYDLVGNLIKVIRPDGGIIVNSYDNMNRNTQVTDAKGQKTKMAYDSAGNLVKLTDPKNNIYRFNYDLLNRKTKMIYPNASFEGYTYDSVSNLRTYSTRIGQIRTYLYDNRNREIKSSWFSPFNEPLPTVTTSYDSAGRLLTMNSNVSSLTFKYTDANELSSESQSVAGAAGAKTIKYSYTQNGLRDSVVYPGGTLVKYTYTGRDQVSSVIANKTVLSKYGYDLNGNLLSKTLNNGTDATCVYDDANRLLELLNRKAATPFASFNYGYDKMSRRTFVKRGNSNGDVYSYDSTDQVTKVLFEAPSPDSIPGTPKWITGYQWDAAGNRLTVVKNGDTTKYTSNNLNQYTKINDSVLPYGKNASLIKFNGWTFTYDGQNRLVLAKKADSTMSFAYDPQNRCVQRKLSRGKLTLSNVFLYYDGWNLIEEQNSLDSQLTQYINGVITDEILTKTAKKSSIYYHYDGLGSVARLTDSAGEMVERYAYDDVFGNTSIRDSTGKVIPESNYGNRFMFTGREYLKEVKLYDYRNRMYSDSLGRFLQPDPIGFNGGNNLYRYVSNNPINLTDELGTSEQNWRQKYFSDAAAWRQQTYANAAAWRQQTYAAAAAWRQQTYANAAAWRQQTYANAAAWRQQTYANAATWRQQTYANAATWRQQTYANAAAWRQQTYANAAAWRQQTYANAAAWRQQTYANAAANRQYLFNNSWRKELSRHPQSNLVLGNTWIRSMPNTAF